MTQPFNAAIIGISGYGETHYNMLMEQAAANRLRPAAATVINQGEERGKCNSLKRHGAELFEDYRRMLAEYDGRLDLCFIPAGIHLHASMARDALAAGANVYVEKPAAATIQDVHSISACAAETKRFVAVGYQHMYADETHELKKRIRDYVGDIRLIKVYSLGRRGSLYYGRNGWAGRIAAGGRWVLDAPFHNPGAHMVNLLCFLAGREQSMPAGLRRVRAELYRATDIEICDTAVIEAVTTDDIRLLYYTTHCSDRSCTRTAPLLTIRGERGNLEMNRDGTFRLVGLDGSVEAADLPRLITGSRQTIMQKVLERIEGGPAYLCEPEAAAAEVLWANAAFESSPIMPVPVSERFEITDRNTKNRQTVIKGIDGIIINAYCAEKLFSEMPISWAAPGEPVDVETYREFNGGKTGRTLS